MQKLKNVFISLYKIRYFILLSSISFFVLIVLLPIYQKGYIGSWDFVKHLHKAKQTVDFIGNHFTIDGWSFDNYAGYQLFLFYSPGFFFLIALIHLASFKLLSVLLIYKTLLVIGYVTLPLNMYYCMRSFKFSKLHSLFSSLFITTFSSVYGLGFESTFTIGLDPQFFAVSLVPLALGVFNNAFRSGKWWNIISSGLLIAFIINCHLQTGIFLFLFLTILIVNNLITYKTKINLLKNIGILGLTVFALTAHWLYPMLQYFDQYGIQTGFGRLKTPDLLTYYFTGRFLTTQLIAILSIAGMALLVFYAFKKKKYFYLFFVAVPVITFLAAIKILNTNISFVNTFLFLQENRAFAPLGIFLAIPAGLAAENIVKLVKQFTRYLSKLFFTIIHKTIKSIKITPINQAVIQKYFARLSILVIIILFFSHVFNTLKLHKNYINIEASHMNNQNHTDLIEACKWIHLNLEHEDKMGIEIAQFSPFPFGGLGQNLYILLKSDQTIFGGGYQESSLTSGFFLSYFNDKYLDSVNVNQFYTKLKQFNIRYLMLKNDPTINKFIESNNFALLHENPVAVIFEVEGTNTNYLSNYNNFKVLSTDFKVDTPYPKLQYKVSNNAINNSITFAISYSRKWRCYIDGIEQEIKKTYQNLLTIKVQNKSDQSDIVLVYKDSPFEMVLKWFAFLSLTGILILLTGRYLFKLISKRKGKILK